MVLQPLAYQSVAMLKLIIIHVPYSTNIAGRNPWQNAAQNTFGKSIGGLAAVLSSTKCILILQYFVNSVFIMTCSFISCKSKMNS